MSLDTAISYEAGEGMDDAKEGANDSGRMTAVDNLLQMPLYSSGSWVVKATAPSLYPNGLGDPANIAVFETVNERLQAAAGNLPSDRRLAVFSGFLSPRNQYKRWQVLYNTRSRKSPWQEIQAGRFADHAGSVARTIDDDVVEATVEQLRRDDGLMRELAENGEAEQLLGELIMYRANNGEIPGVRIDIMSAQSIHNLGHSVNVGLLNDHWEFQNMGVGIDIPDSPVQSADYFESNGQDEYEREMKAEPLLVKYLEGIGVFRLDERLIERIKTNRRELFHAMTDAGFGSYLGEQGHFTATPVDGGMPSRAHTYSEARRFGYQID